MLIRSSMATTCVAVALLSATPASGGPLSRAKSWNETRAAHLLRRAGFGGTQEQIQRLTGLGLKAAVRHLVDYERIKLIDPPFEASRFTDPRAFKKHLRGLPEEQRRGLRQQVRAISQYELQILRAWWIRRMVTTPRPFEEKMTLFWHGHFTTGAQEVKSVRLLSAQNELFRQEAIGPFGDLVSAVCRDPAMLQYLDNASNRKKHPNENFARELLELFTLGEGNYTEEDIREAARALTGRTFDEQGYRFRKGWHDAGEKTFLGQTGRFDGDDVVRIIMEQPATAQFLAEKLLKFFVSDLPSARLVGAVAETLLGNGYDVRETTRKLFLSESFYAADVMFEHIKSPPEVIVGTLSSLGIVEADFLGLARLMESMGQNLFQPPNVKGWDGGETWITSATIFKRQRFADLVLGGGPESHFKKQQMRLREYESIRDELKTNLGQQVELRFARQQIEYRKQPTFKPWDLFPREQRVTLGYIVDHCAAVLLNRPLDAVQRKAIIQRWGTADQTIDISEARYARWIIAIMREIMKLPEYQLS